jgi:sarcosine oxidase
LVAKPEVAVIGLGAIGAATLHRLARMGVPAVGIDQFPEGHTNGSSHGETRITREAVGEGAAYVPLVQRSHQIWRELEDESGKKLFVACGGIIIGPPERTVGKTKKPDFVRNTIDFAEKFGIKSKLLKPDDVKHCFPQFNLQPEDSAYYEDGAGFLYPETCIAVQLEFARKLKAEIVRDERVVAIAQRDGLVQIKLANRTIEASRAVVAAGGWTARLLGEPYASRIVAYRQVVHYFTPEDPALYDHERCPIFIRIHGGEREDYYYGFPTPPGSSGVKVATENFRSGDVVTDMAAVDRRVAEREVDEVYEHHVRGELNGVTRRTAQASQVCVYSNTKDGHFLIDAHPDMPRVLVVSACSGHGFKHSAAVGELAAAEVVASTRLAPFRLTHPANIG